MNPLILSALILLPIFGFILGGYVGSRSGFVAKVWVFRDLDNLIDVVEHVTAITNDHRISAGVVIEHIQSAKYGLRLPELIERAEDRHPPT